MHAAALDCGVSCVCSLSTDVSMKCCSSSVDWLLWAEFNWHYRSFLVAAKLCVVVRHAAGGDTQVVWESEAAGRQTRRWHQTVTAKFKGIRRLACKYFTEILTSHYSSFVAWNLHLRMCDVIWWTCQSYLAEFIRSSSFLSFCIGSNCKVLYVVLVLYVVVVQFTLHS